MDAEAVVHGLRLADEGLSPGALEAWRAIN
jgi:hypothetical protein